MFLKQIHKTTMMVLVFSAIAILSVGCGQTSQSFDSEIAIADNGGNLMNELKWTEFTEVLHPEALQKFRTILMPSIEGIVPPDKPDTVNLFGKILVMDSLRNLTDKEFFVDMMNIVFSLSPDIGATFMSMQNSMVGAIADGSDLVHVVVHTDMNVGGREIKEMNVITLKKDGADWKHMLSPKIEGIILMVQQTLNQMKV